MGFTLARLGAAIMLIVALGQHPYDYYTILRWIVCGVSAYGAYAEFERKRPAWGWTFVVLAAAFNPIAPVYLTRESWAPIDVLAAVVLIVSVVENRTAKEIRH